MKNSNKQILFLILMILLSLPLLQSTFHVFSVQPLKGAITKVTVPELTYSSFDDGSFQEKFDKYIENNIGLRPFFIRSNNQVAFSLYNKALARDVIIGKDNYLYELNYIKAYLGHDFIGKDVIREKVRKLKQIQDTLKKLNTNLVILFAPGKATFYPEYIPDEFNPQEKSLSNYSYYIQQCNELDVEHIDFNDYFLMMKDTVSYPIYPKCGIHWSSYGVSIVVDSLLTYFEEKCPELGVPDLSINNIDITRKLRDTDYDIGEGMNLLFRISNPKMAYPALNFTEKEGKVKPNLIVVADSYYWNIYGKGYSSRMFNNNSFWYYFKQSYNPEYPEHPGPKEVTSLNIKDEIEDQDFILLISTDANLFKFPFGFINNVYDIYFNK